MVSLDGNTTRPVGGGEPILRLTDSSVAGRPSWSWFCSHCGHPPASNWHPVPLARLCPACEFGLLIGAPSELVPESDQPFLVADCSGTVRAVSRSAELALGVNELEAINRHVTELVVPVDLRARQCNELRAAIAGAASCDDARTQMLVRPVNALGVKMHASIAPCTPPRAALLVLGAP
jgi:hypothetical protein